MAEPSSQDIAEALAAGGVGLLPTDTVYGLAARPDRRQAIEKIFILKNRPQSLNLQILLPFDMSPDSLGAIVSQEAAKLLAEPGMRANLTSIFALDPARKPGWLSHRVEAGFRAPADVRIQAVLARTGPLFATSANAHGEPPGAEPSLVLPRLNGAPDIVWDAGPLTGAASTVVNFNADPPAVLRWGAVTDLSEWGLGHG